MLLRSSLLATAFGVLALVPAADAARTLYSPNSTSGVLSAWSVGGGSALTPLLGSPFAAAGGPQATVMTPNGKFLFVTKSSTDVIERFSIGADGTPTSLGSTTPGPISGPRNAAVSPDGTKLYVAGNNGLHTWTIGADGSLTSAPPSRTMDTTIGVDVAVTPDGKWLYALGVNVAPDDIIFRIPLGADGNPTANGVVATTAPDSLQRLAVTPDGRHLLTASSAAGAQGARIYAIGAGGALTQVPGSPFAVGGSTFTVATSPTAPVVFAGEVDTDTVRAFTVGAGGALTPVGPALPAGGDPLAMAVSPSGRSLFVTSTGPEVVARFDVAADGTLSGAGATVPHPAGVGVAPHVSPDQAPAAALTATGAQAGAPAQFDASGSTDPDGSVARYDWDFGDGTTLADGGAKPTHAYATAGTYTARVTVTDDESCSTSRTYTGQVASCAGSAAATTTAAVTATEPPAAPAPAPVVTPVPISLPTATTCASKRHFSAKHLGLKKGERITKARLYRGKKLVRKLKAARRSVDVRLAGLPKATYTLKVTAKKRGRSRTIKRTYRTCRPGT